MPATQRAPTPPRRMPAAKAWLAPLLACALAWPAAAAAATRPQEPLTPLMAGEFALQAGQLEQAAHWYLQAARAVDDAGLAERATRIALLANRDDLAEQGLALWRKRAARSPGMGGVEATLALRRGDARTARRQLQALLRSGDDIGWRHALVALGSGGKDPQLVAQVLEALVEADAIPDRLQAWLAFGGLAQRLQRPELAARIVDIVVERFPGEPRVALLRASQLREAGDREGARRALAAIGDQALLLDDLRWALAAEYGALGEYAEAARVMARGPQDERSYRLRASLLAEAEDEAGLTALYDELRADSARPDPERRLLLGQVAEFLDRHAEALEWYRSVPGGPLRSAARLRGANVLHELGRRDEAYAELGKLQADAAAEEDARRDAYLLEAELRQKDRAPEAEMDAFARGLAAFPDDPALLYSRALAWERRDDIPRAEADLRRILAIEPDNVSALNALGYTLADRTDRYAEALELIDRARAAEPDNAAIIDSHGWVLYRLGRHQEALVQLRRAYSMQKDAEIAAHIAEVLWVLGRQDEARTWFEEARKLDPDNRALKRALEKFRP